MHECTVCVGDGTSRVGSSVDGLFRAATARQWRHTDPRQHHGSRLQNHNNFVCLCAYVCVCGYVFSFNGSFVWLMYYDTMMNNVWQKSLKIPFKHETAPARLWILNVSSVSCYFAVLWRTGLHHKNSKSCSFPSTLVGICDFFLQDGRDGCPAS